MNLPEIHEAAGWWKLTLTQISFDVVHNGVFNGGGNLPCPPRRWRSFI